MIYKIEKKGIIKDLKIFIKTYNDFKAADEFITYLETFRLVDSSVTEMQTLESQSTEQEKGELVTINRRIDELKAKRYLTEAETAELNELQSRKVEIVGGNSELQYNVEADGSNKFKDGTKILASEIDILSVDEKDEISIKDVALNIAKAYDYQDMIEFDSSYSDGQYKKTADNSKLKKLIKDFEFTKFEVGINNSVNWFIKNYNNCRK